MCKFKKEIWDTQEVTCEGICKDTRIRILLKEYELFKMNEYNSIVEMYERFSRKTIYECRPC
ncbi:unnamed protein product [Linum tenue]|uniref:Uncharacterized protein n=1 Tax=Linum tenue TaxID=586396 RepID=A0AAV0NSK7_9ROSI|nr:unnamed protein product [Linum tenue]